MEKIALRGILSMVMKSSMTAGKTMLGHVHVAVHRELRTDASDEAVYADSVQQLEKPFPGRLM